jgi:hypothetical protein
MRFFLGISVFIFFLVSCKKEQAVPKPVKVIPEEVMVSILYDLSVLQAMSNHNIAPEINKNIPDFLEEKYGIDSLQFVENNRYYASQIKVYQKIYEQVYERIKKETQLLETN